MDSLTNSTLVPSQIISRTGERNRQLLFEYGSPAGSSKTTSDFRMQITDPEDPLFLFDFSLSSPAFSRIKEDQCLYCEFSSFPKSVSDLLQECKNGDYFRAVIDDRNHQMPALMFQQLTKISLLTHLKLDLTPASDSRLNCYLAGEIKRLKEKGKMNEDEICHIKEQSNESTSNLSSKASDLIQQIEKQRADFSEEKRKLEQRFEIEAKESQTKFASQMQEKDAELEMVRSSITSEYESQIKSYQEQMCSMREEKSRIMAQCEKLSEKNRNTEEQLSEVREMLTMSEEKLKRTEEKLLEESKQNGMLQTEAVELKSMVQSLRADLNQKSGFSASAMSTLSLLRKQIDDKEKEIEELRNKCEEYEQKAKERDWIAEKAKVVIEKGRSDMDKLMKHHTERKIQWQQSEKIIKELQNSLVKGQEEMNSIKSALENEKRSKDKLRKDAESASKKVEEMEKQKVSDQNLIKYLEAQLNGRVRASIENNESINLTDDALQSDS